MEAIRGRSYSLHILDVLLQGKESTFTEIIKELGISPTTLSLTLHDLVYEGFAEKRVYGRSSFYSITEKGRNILKSLQKSPQFDIDRMTQLVVKRLRENGNMDKFSDVSNEQLIRTIRSKVKDFIKQIPDEIRKETKGGR